MNKSEFTTKLSGLKRGDFVIYHTGFLWVDRRHSTDVDEVGHAALDAWRSGDVVLLQERVSPGVCDYWAVKT